MNEYPIFIKSNAYSRIEKSKPLLPKEPDKPSQPKLIKKNWLEKIILSCDEYEDQAINLKRTERYIEKLLEYSLEMQRYNERIKEMLSETNLTIYRNERKKGVLSETIFAKSSNRDTLKGRYEPYFYTHLVSKFGNKIYDNLEFELPNLNAFVPDFTYIDKLTGLCIDIEIDEPYSSIIKEPIHCLGDDDYRNDYFAERGWFIVRFAEIQIAKYPTQSCEYIQAIIDFIIDGKEFQPFLYPVKSWNYSDSIEMATNEFRNSY